MRYTLMFKNGNIVITYSDEGENNVFLRLRNAINKKENVFLIGDVVFRLDELVSITCEK